MADETKEPQETKVSGVPKKKINWKARRLPIIITAVVVVTVIGVAGWAWHTTPECCDTVCHSTMGKYYDSFVNDPTTLVYKHRSAANNQCLGCHEATLPQMMHEVQMQLTGDYTQPFSKVTFSNDFCLQSGCHLGGGIMPGATTSSTANLSFDPHSDKHGVQQCNSCHLMHDQSVFTCASCHTFSDESKIPEGWVKITLEDGSVTAAPKGWTIPTNFQASVVE